MQGIDSEPTCPICGTSMLFPIPDQQVRNMRTHYKSDLPYGAQKKFARTGTLKGLMTDKMFFSSSLTTSARASMAAMTPFVRLLQSLLFIGLEVIAHAMGMGKMRLHENRAQRQVCCSKAEVKLKAFWKGLWKGAWTGLDTCWRAGCNNHRQPFSEKSQSSRSCTMLLGADGKQQRM